MQVSGHRHLSPTRVQRIGKFTVFVFVHLEFGISAAVFSGYRPFPSRSKRAFGKKPVTQCLYIDTRVTGFPCPILVPDVINLKITLLTGPPGCQKTRTMLREVLAVPGRYLVACERIDLIEEHSQFLQQEAQRASIGLPDLRHIHGQQRRAGNVARQMGDAATELSTSQHAVVFITHEGLRLGDLGNFAGWHARIDEQPQSVASIPSKRALPMPTSSRCTTWSGSLRGSGGWSGQAGDAPSLRRGHQ